MKILLTAVNSKYIHSNLAIYSLKAYHDEHLNSKDVVGLAEYTINQTQEDIIKDIYKRQPDMIAFSCYIWNIELIYCITRELKKILPHTDIWLGGPEVSFDAQEILKSHKDIKGILLGEGEETFTELSACYEKNEVSDNNLSKIRQICYKKANNEIAATLNRELLNMDDLPFVYKDMSIFEHKIIYYESSRGCPFGCSYCLSSVSRSVRFRSLPLVFKELQIFLDAKVPQVKFVDRTFNCNHERTLELFKFLRTHDNGVTNFHFEVAADLLNEEELVEIAAMREGLVQLEIGVQSTNPQTIREIDRTMDLKKLRCVVEYVNKSGNVHQHLDLIAGLPYEDLEHFKKSFNDVYSMRPEQLQLGFLKVLKGSKMYTNAGQYGIVYTDTPPYQVLYTKWISFSEMLELKAIEEMTEVYYNSRQYVHSMDYLLTFFDNPYNMFKYLADYYEKNNLSDVKHSRMTRYQHFYNAGMQKISEDLKSEQKSSEEIKSESSCFTQLLIFDLYERENLKTRPSFAQDLQPYRKYIKEMAVKYNVPKTAHFELFSKTVLKIAGVLDTSSEIGNSQQEWVIFDYEKRSRLNYSAAVKVVEM